MIESGATGKAEAIERRIEELRTELGRAEGTPTEVYSRIVGYYRSVRNWNAGKRDEYAQRRAFAMPDSAAPAALPAAPAALPAAPAALPAAPSGGVGSAAREAERASMPEASAFLEARSSRVPAPGGASIKNGILVFTRESCPNCSPVANFVRGAGLEAMFVDVDQAEGLELARNFGIMATPTVLALDEEGREAFRAFGVGELRALLERSGRGSGRSEAP